MANDTITIKDLDRITDRSTIKAITITDPSKIQDSIHKYKPQVWREDGVYHTVLGRIPEDCIWTIGTTPEESMIEFDKELKLSLKPNGEIKFLSQKERQELHKEVWEKIKV